MADNPFLNTVQDVQINRATMTLAQSAFPTQPGMVREQAAVTASTAKETGASIQEISQRSRSSMAMAQKHGMDPSFGLRVGQSNTAFASAWQKEGESEKLGFGGLNNQKAGSLDQELRLAAAKSPMANALGALHAMKEAGLIDQKKLDAIQKDDNGRTRMPAAMMDELKKAGVDARTAGQFMSSTKANMEQVAKHNLQDEVRGMQKDQIGGIIAQDLAGNLQGGFRDQGMGKKAAREQSQKTAAELTKRLMADPSLLDDSKRMEGAFDEMGLDKKQGAGAIQALKNRVMDDTNLKKFGNLKGLIAMNTGAREGGDKMMNEADKNADDVRDKMDAAEEARKGQIKEQGELRTKLGIKEGESGEALQKALKARLGKLEKKPEDMTPEEVDEFTARNPAAAQEEIAGTKKLMQLEEAGEVEKAASKTKQGFGDTTAGGSKGLEGIKIGGTLTLLDGGEEREVKLEGQGGGAPGGG